MKIIRKTIQRLLLCILIGIFLCVRTFAENEDFIPRLTAPAVMHVETTGITPAATAPAFTITTAETAAITTAATAENQNAKTENIDPMPVIRVIFLIIIAMFLIVRLVIPLIRKLDKQK